jgi:Domain of unknown function (DUF4365)
VKQRWRYCEVGTPRHGGTPDKERIGPVPGRCALGCEWCLDQNNHQGWYGESFIRALAAAAGLEVSRAEPDCTGIDFTITATREIDGDFPAIKVQVKSWSAPVERASGWRYDRLTQKRFNALAGRNRRFPRFLFLVIVPPDRTRYARADKDALHLSYAAYWVSLADRDKIQGAACSQKVPITIPRQNLLTAESLLALCEGTAAPGSMAS